MLTAEQIKKLDSINMIWVSRTDYLWSIAFEEAKKYAGQKGNLNVPTKYISETGYKLGAWICAQRTQYKLGKLYNERIEKLNSIGMVWQNDGWLTRYELARKYYEEHGNLNITQNTVIDGVWLGKWLVQQRKYMEQGKLTVEQAELMDRLPIENGNCFVSDWLAVYADCKEYFSQHGNLKPPVNYSSKSGVKLADWLARQRKLKRDGTLSGEQIELLDRIGFEWVVKNTWKSFYAHAIEYKAEKGDLNTMPYTYKSDDGYCLGVVLSKYRTGAYELSVEQKKLFLSLA